MKLISDIYFDSYQKKLSEECLDLDINFESSEQDISAEDFEFYAIASSLYSSKIEGNSLAVEPEYLNVEFEKLFNDIDY